MPKKSGGGTSRIVIKWGQGASEIASIAARELAEGIAAMLGRSAAAQADLTIDARAIVIALGADAAANPGPNTLIDDSFQVSRPSDDALAIQAGSERGLLHASYDLMERLGARFVP